MKLSFIDNMLNSISKQWEETREEVKRMEAEDKAFEQEQKERLAFDGKYTSLFYYVLTKNFLKNWKDYLLLMICNVVIFGFVVIGFGVQDIMIEVSAHRGTGLFSDVTTILLNTMAPMAIISIVMIIILFFYYLKCRARNNGVLLTLGIRRQSLYYFVIAEFVSVLLVSMIIGGIAGRIVLAVFMNYSEELLGFAVDTSVIGVKTFLKAFGVTFLMYLFSAMLSRDIYVDFNVGRNADVRARREKIFRSKNLIFIIIGLVLTIGCIFLYSKPLFYENIYLLIITFVGMFFVIFFGIAKYLLNERKGTSYLKKLLLHNQLFHKSRTNSAYIYSLILIQFCVLFYFPFQGISAAIVEDADELYPYDLVCLANDSDDTFFESLKDTYELEYTEYPMIRVSNNDVTENGGTLDVVLQGQHIGVSESSFHAMKKQLDPSYKEKPLGLDKEGKLIYIVFQQAQSAKAKRLDYTVWSNQSLLHAGVVCPWVEPFRVNRGFDIQYFYRRSVGQEIGSLTGAFHQGYQENIVVFSDEYFESVQDNWKFTSAKDATVIENEADRVLGAITRQGPRKLILINAEEDEMEKILAEMPEFAENHVEDGKYDSTITPYYTKEQGIRSIQSEQVMKITMNLLLMILFFVMNMMLIVVKILSEKDLNKRRTEFLNCMGMRKRDRVKFARKEVLYYFHMLPMVIAMVLSVAFTVAGFVVRQFTAADISSYLQYMIPVWGIYAVGSSVALMIIVTIYIHQLEGK